MADDQAEYLLNLCRAKPDMGNKAIIAEMREVFAAPPTQPEQRGEVVASVKESLTVRAAFEAWLAWWSTLPNDRDKHGYCDMTVEMLSHAYAAGMTSSAQVEQRGDSPEDRAEQFIQAAIDRAPEPLRRLGEYLTRVLDEDEWPTAESLLLGIAAAPPAPAVPDDVAKDAEKYRALTTPEIVDFIAAIEREALHQRDRWGVEHDAGKGNGDWAALLIYLIGKAVKAHYENDRDKLMHHVITTAAACMNWHAALLGIHNRMRPGVEKDMLAAAPEPTR